MDMVEVVAALSSPPEQIKNRQMLADVRVQPVEAGLRRRVGRCTTSTARVADVDRVAVGVVGDATRSSDTRARATARHDVQIATKHALEHLHEDGESWLGAEHVRQSLSDSTSGSERPDVPLDPAEHLVEAAGAAHEGRAQLECLLDDRLVWYGENGLSVASTDESVIGSLWPTLAVDPAAGRPLLDTTGDCTEESLIECRLVLDRLDVAELTTDLVEALDDANERTVDNSGGVSCRTPERAWAPGTLLALRISIAHRIIEFALLAAQLLSGLVVFIGATLQYRQAILELVDLRADTLDLAWRAIKL